MGRSMNYINTGLRGVPSSNSPFYRYEQVGYLKGILNYSSEKAVKEYIESEEFEQKLDEIVEDYIESSEVFEDRVRDISLDVVDKYTDSEDFRKKILTEDEVEETIIFFPNEEEEG